MPIFQRQKNKFLKHHYQKENIHPEQLKPVIDPNLISLIEWAIYVGRWMPGAIGSYSRLAEAVWEIYKGYYQNKSIDELFVIAVSSITKSKTKGFILKRFYNSFSHVFTSPADLSKKPEYKYFGKSKQQQLPQIEAHEVQIKNYILSQIAQKYGKKQAERVQSKYGDNFSEIILSVIISMTADKEPMEKQQKIKQKKYCFF